MAASAGITMVLERFRDGILVPEFGIRIPWRITESELYQYIPHEAFTFSIAGWPLLNCTILGISGSWGFNFVTHPHAKLVEVAIQNLDRRTIQKTFARASKVLIDLLGSPNSVNLPSSNQRWSDDWGFVANSVHIGYFALLRRRRKSHSVKVFFRAAMLNSRPVAGEP